MRHLIVSRELPPASYPAGGIGTYVANIAELLATHGDVVHLIGERWAMPLIRELLLGPRRFGDLKTSLNGISANVLTQRLEGLEAAGVLVRRRCTRRARVPLD